MNDTDILSGVVRELLNRPLSQRRDPLEVDHITWSKAYFELEALPLVKQRGVVLRADIPYVNFLLCGVPVVPKS